MHSVIEWIDSRRRHPLLEPSGRADVRVRASRRWARYWCRSTHTCRTSTTTAPWCAGS